jgi:hypothetical protein
VKARAFVVALTLGGLAGCARHPSDREMIERFNAHREEFQMLADEALTDVGSVGRDEYQRRLAALGIGGVGVGNQLRGEVTFSMSSKGVGFAHGSSKGFLYTPTIPDPLLDSLEGKAVRAYASAYRRIADRWYLYLYRD